MLPISPAWNPFWEGLKRHIFRLGFEVRWAYINVPSVGCIVEGNFGWGRESKRFWQTQSYHVQRIWVPFWRHPIIFKRRPSKTAFCNRSKPPPEYWHTQRKQSQPQQGETPWGKCAPLPRISTRQNGDCFLELIPHRVEVEQKKNVAKVRCVKWSSPNWWCK